MHKELFNNHEFTLIISVLKDAGIKRMQTENFNYNEWNE